MKITSTYSVRLRNFNLVFDDTVEVYRHAVDYFIELVMANWNTHFANLSHANDCIRVADGLSVRTIKRPMTPYNFCHDFEKFPCYLRRAAIKAAYEVDDLVGGMEALDRGVPDERLHKRTPVQVVPRSALKAE